MYRWIFWAIGDLAFHMRRWLANILWSQQCVRCGRRRCSGHAAPPVRTGTLRATVAPEARYVRYSPPPPRSGADALLGAGRLLPDDRDDLLQPWQAIAQQESDRL
jgi:hypothetical protein